MFDKGYKQSPNKKKRDEPKKMPPETTRERPTFEQSVSETEPQPNENMNSRQMPFRFCGPV